MATALNQEKTVNYTDGLPVPADGRIAPLLNAWDIKWGDGLGQGVILTYSFPGSGAAWRSGYSPDSEPADMTRLNASQQAAFTAALDTWSDVADITFVLKVDSTTNLNNVAVIRAALYDDMGLSAAGWGYLPGFFASSGDVWLNPLDFNDPAAYAVGTYGFTTLIHEIGHALGLNHPNDNGLEPGFDNRSTIMSYNPHPKSLFRDVSDGGNAVDWIPIDPETPMPRDILAIQYLYGPNMSHATGDDVYTFDPADPFIRTIWDAGGDDTIDVSNFTRGCRIDLVAGHFSDITIPSDPKPDWVTNEPGGIYNGKQNLAIAYNVTIENATGGSGHDNLVGNGAANVLIGNDGNDKLNGKGGTDLLQGGNGKDTYFINAATEIDKNEADAGVDTVKSNVAYTLGAEQENLKLTGGASINGTGNGGDNVIKGNGAANSLDGGAGADTLSGRIGKDVLTGGTGTDIFRFDSKIGGGNVDRIEDFTPSEDVLHLPDTIFLRLKAAIRDETGSGPVAIRAGEFASNPGGTPIDKSDRILYNEDKGTLYYDPDGTGAKAAIKIAVLTGAPALEFDDILVYAG